MNARLNGILVMAQNEGTNNANVGKQYYGVLLGLKCRYDKAMARDEARVVVNNYTVGMMDDGLSKSELWFCVNSS